MASTAAVAAAVAYAGHLARPVPDVAADLDRYVALLTRWQAAQNLVSRETLPAVWPRHIVDSLQLLRHLTPADRTFLDLGSGGGFPAIPLAIARKGAADLSFVLVESTGRKASFLRLVARELNLPIRVVASRIEAFDPREMGRPDVITSRALASLDRLCRFAAPHFGPGTRALFHKGRDAGEELANARAEWELDVVSWPSDTSSDGVLLEIRNMRSLSAS
jgi:16S rRNA (guanine527-N7)-methyltransferase